MKGRLILATVRIVQRSKRSLTLVIDHGIDSVSGKRKKETRTLQTTDVKEAEIERLKILTQLASGVYKRTRRTTLGEYIDYWFTTSVAKSLASKTIERYKQCAELRIKPWIGGISLCELTRKDLMSFYERIIKVGRLDNKISKKDVPVGKDTVAYHHRFIRRILNHALYEDEIIDKNVAMKLKPPEPKDITGFDADKDVVKVFTADEIITLENLAKGSPYKNLLSVALRTGMRREELLALTYDCIDFEDRSVTIKRALIYTKGNGFEFKTTKNKKRRVIEITSFVIDAIKNEMAIQQKYRERLKKNFIETGLIFTNSDGTNLHPDQISSWFPKFCMECGVTRLTFHCLRHTHASHLLASGEDISYVSKRLGHSSIQVTYNTYFHFIPHEKREALQKLDERFRR